MGGPCRPAPPPDVRLFRRGRFPKAQGDGRRRLHGRGSRLSRRHERGRDRSPVPCARLDGEDERGLPRRLLDLPVASAGHCRPARAQRGFAPSGGLRPRCLRRGPPHDRRGGERHEGVGVHPCPQGFKPRRPEAPLHDGDAAHLQRQGEGGREGRGCRPLLDGRSCDLRHGVLPHRLRQGGHEGASFRLQGTRPRRARNPEGAAQRRHGLERRDQDGRRGQARRLHERALEDLRARFELHRRGGPLPHAQGRRWTRSSSSQPATAPWTSCSPSGA